MKPLNHKSGVIRAITPDDLSVLKTVIDAVGLFPPEMLDEMTTPFLTGGSGGEFWLTFDDGGPQAILYCAPERMTAGTWNLLLIAVHPERQGQGIGAALMAQVERQLAADGARILLVETSGLPEFEATRAFYARIGYDREARIRDFYNDGEDKIVFRKALGG